MDFLDNLLTGFSVALLPTNFAYCLIGATLGTLVGVLPGLGPITTMAMLLPITFKMPAAASLIMLSGIYYGAHHAGSTTAIMLNMPGEPTSVVICLDGSPMARQGRAGAALCISALSSFFAGCVSVAIIALFAPALAKAAASFGAAEYVSLVVLALTAVSVVSSGPAMTTLAMVVLGLLLGTIGTDINSGYERFTFGMPSVAEGVNFIALAVGLFAFAHIINEIGAGQERPRTRPASVKGLLPTRADLAASWKPILRGTGLGAIIGIFPGTGPLIAAFASYSVEKKLAADPSRFGTGAIEGVAGPEAANNAAAFTHFIPMLTMGIPAGAAMALMLGALTIQGVSAGPQLMLKHPDLFWGVIASMMVGNLMLLVLNLPLIGIWIRLLSIPYRLLYPSVLVLCCIGTYSVANSAQDVVLAAVAGFIGFLFIKLDCPPSPFLLGFILEAPFEENLRRALILSHGDVYTFVERPISLGLLICAATVLAALCAPALRRCNVRSRFPRRSL